MAMGERVDLTLSKRATANTVADEMELKCKDVN
jgi:hypothetical protein